MARIRKVSKEAYNYIVDTLRENGSMSQRKRASNSFRPLLRLRPARGT